MDTIIKKISKSIIKSNKRIIKKVLLLFIYKMNSVQIGEK